jgi:hypothetical protein
MLSDKILRLIFRRFYRSRLNEMVAPDYAVPLDYALKVSPRKGAWRGAALEVLKKPRSSVAVLAGPQTWLNKRLPLAFQRVIRSLSDQVLKEPRANLEQKHRVHLFAGAACLAPFWVFHRSEKNIIRSPAHALKRLRSRHHSPRLTCIRRGSNSQPLPPEGNALSS